MAAKDEIDTPLLRPAQVRMPGDASEKSSARLEDQTGPGSTCNCCLGKRDKPELSLEEKQVLKDLREAYCNEPFDANSSQTDRFLVEIWNMAFPGELVDKADNSPRWTRLGFQSNNPRTDVRTGLFPLLQFRYFLKNYPDKAQQLVRQAETFEYPIAITSFNLTHMIVVFFDLFGSHTVSPVSGAEQANLEQLRNFSSLCKSAGNVVLDELLCVLLQRLHLTWKHMKAVENANLMDFPKALRSVYDAHSEFWKVPRKEISDLQLLLDGVG